MVKNKNQVKDQDRRRGLLGKRSRAEINRIPNIGHGCSSSSNSSSRAVLGEVSGEKQHPAEMQKETEPNLGGADLLLSLSTGRWG